MANRVAGLLSQLFRYGIHRQVVEFSPVQLLFRPGGTERPAAKALWPRAFSTARPGLLGIVEPMQVIRPLS